MLVQERIVNVQRHTVGYVISGKSYTKPQAVKLARQGRLTNARFVKGRTGTHIMGKGTSLYGLPARIQAKSRTRSR